MYLDNFSIFWAFLGGFKNIISFLIWFKIFGVWMSVEPVPECLERMPFNYSAFVFFKWGLVIFYIIFLYGCIWEQPHKQVSSDLEKFFLFWVFQSRLLRNLVVVLWRFKISYWTTNVFISPWFNSPKYSSRHVTSLDEINHLFEKKHIQLLEILFECLKLGMKLFNDFSNN